MKVSRAYNIGHKAGAYSLSLYASLEQQGVIISVTATLTMLTLHKAIALPTPFQNQSISYNSASHPFCSLDRGILNAVEFERLSNALDLPRGASCGIGVCMHRSIDNYVRFLVVFP
jgi:hypothetical protein